MADERVPYDPDWPRGFDEHSLAQRRRLAKLPFAEKLKWLEEAHELVRRLQRERGEPGRGDGSRE